MPQTPQAFDFEVPLRNNYTLLGNFLFCIVLVFQYVHGFSECPIASPGKKNCHEYEVSEPMSEVSTHSLAFCLLLGGSLLDKISRRSRRLNIWSMLAWISFSTTAQKRKKNNCWKRDSELKLE